MSPEVFCMATGYVYRRSRYTVWFPASVTLTRLYHAKDLRFHPHARSHVPIGGWISNNRSRHVTFSSPAARGLAPSQPHIPGVPMPPAQARKYRGEKPPNSRIHPSSRGRLSPSGRLDSSWRERDTSPAPHARTQLPRTARTPSSATRHVPARAVSETLPRGYGYAKQAWCDTAIP